MSSRDAEGMSIRNVAILTFLLVGYFLWGGAAAIYKAHMDRTAALLAEEAGELDVGGEDSELTVQRGSALIRAIEVAILGVCTFVFNSATQLGNLPDLIPYLFQERMGYLTFCVFVLSVTGLGLFGLWRMQKSLEAENPFSRGRKR